MNFTLGDEEALTGRSAPNLRAGKKELIEEQATVAAEERTKIEAKHAEDLRGHLSKEEALKTALDGHVQLIQEQTDVLFDHLEKSKVVREDSNSFQ